MQALRSLPLVFAALALVGCSDSGAGAAARHPVYPVSGKILYKGLPVPEADITFVNEEKNISAYARTDAQGEFKITTYSPNDGAIAGKHIVLVRKIIGGGGSAKPDAPVESTDYQPPGFGDQPAVAPDPVAALPIKYSDAKTSDQFVVVTEGTNPPVTLELKD